MQRIRGRKADILAWTNPDEIEGVALEQLKNISSLPWVFHHVAAMPDVHYGKGATVGSVIAMKGAVSPAAVGVDVGCGVGAVKTSLTAKDLPDDLRAWRSALERAIPVGFHEHRDPIERPQDKAFWEEFHLLTPAVKDLMGKARRQLGTLGGGNHFIELCLDTEDRVWMMLYSGSRNIGKSLAEIHIQRAKKLAHNQDLPDRDLAVFLSGTREMDEYRRDLFWAQSFESASHGAGRRMSRGEAKRRFSVRDLMEQTKGVECRKDGGVLDEIPAAYKPIEQVMENQKDLVEVVAELRQVLCVKG